ncbi:MULTISPECIES: hypothetical protein [unclassified Rhizobium]|uniref:hypothetical protein n=1 Tax=unclassified Rhizobium TaxID=2613769 RepID=UPI000BC6C844|nr:MULTISPECIES: hypothetical protein [unclassified Rhizobium]MDH7804890.1 hypothetical protein [Rhizobium sp. AN67]MDQ4406511.1 hypothetical protein [Rhizobium sp. AN63]SOD56290.1 hypothetical protein SAMN05216595_2997 [Rhizobium sp. AN6A]
MSDEFKLYVSAAGRHPGGGFSQYVTASSLQDATEQEVWCDYAEAPKLEDGTQPQGIYTAIRTALLHVPDGRCVLIFAPQSFVAAIFSVSREERRAARYRGSNKKPRPNADLLRDIDDETERRGITLRSREPELHSEFDMLDMVRAAATERLEAASHAADAKFES